MPNNAGDKTTQLRLMSLPYCGPRGTLFTSAYTTLKLQNFLDFTEKNHNVRLILCRIALGKKLEKLVLCTCNYQDFRLSLSWKMKNIFNTKRLNSVSPKPGKLFGEPRKEFKHTSKAKICANHFQKGLFTSF